MATPIITQPALTGGHSCYETTLLPILPRSAAIARRVLLVPPQPFSPMKPTHGGNPPPRKRGAKKKDDMKQYSYSYQIDGYLIQSASVQAESPKQARDKIRAMHKGRKVSSFIPN